MNGPVENQIHFTVHIEHRQKRKKNSFLRSLSPGQNELLRPVCTYCLGIRLHHRLTGKLGTEPILSVKQSVSMDTETVREMYIGGSGLGFGFGLGHLP